MTAAAAFRGLLRASIRADGRRLYTAAASAPASTRSKALREAAGALARAGIPSAYKEAELLLAHTLQINRIALLLGELTTTLTPAQLVTLQGYGAAALTAWCAGASLSSVRIVYGYAPMKLRGAASGGGAPQLHHRQERVLVPRL